MKLGLSAAKTAEKSIFVRHVEIMEVIPIGRMPCLMSYLYPDVENGECHACVVSQTVENGRVISASVRCANRPRRFDGFIEREMTQGVCSNDVAGAHIFEYSHWETPWFSIQKQKRQADRLVFLDSQN